MRTRYISGNVDPSAKIFDQKMPKNTLFSHQSNILLKDQSFPAVYLELIIKLKDSLH